MDVTDYKLSESDCKQFAKGIAGDRYDRVKSIGELDMAATYGDGSRCRINIYRCSGVPVTALRILSDHIPAMEELGLPRRSWSFPLIRRA